MLFTYGGSSMYMSIALSKKLRLAEIIYIIFGGDLWIPKLFSE